MAGSLQAAQQLDWDAYSEFVHPDALRDFRDKLVLVLQASEKQNPEGAAGLLSLFAGAKDMKTVLAWEPKAFFARFMNGTVSQSPMKDHFTAETNVVGMVAEGPEQTHVLVRVSYKMPTGTVRKMEVMTLRLDGQTWKLLLPGELAGLTETLSLSQSGEAVQAPPDVTLPANPDK